MKANTAAQMWAACDGLRRGMLTRMERYAALTIPKVLLPSGFNHESTDQTHDYQSIGAEAVNHISNKLMLAMFAPSRPFVKLKAGKKAMAEAEAMGVTQTQLDAILAKGERDAIAELDSRGQRPKLFQIMRHLVVTGNVLLVLAKDGIRVIGIRNYVVKRNIAGEVMHIVIREQIKFDELDSKIVDLLGRQHSEDSTVEFFKWVKRERNGAYTMTQWVNGAKLPKEYDGRWPAERCPYQVITWDLADEANYGTGLVEEYIGDLEAISTLSESVVDGAVQGTEYRWMVNPTGMTSVDDLNNSENGDALPGMPEDVKATQGGNPEAINVASAVLDKYERRVSRGFLMGSAVIRDAERVTQEEVRLTAQELETAYGGVYATLAASLQAPVARWLFDSIDIDLKGADLDVTIITGLDALSRNGDLENFRAAMGDMAAIVTVPPELSARIKWEEIAAFVGQGRNIDLARFLLTDKEFAEKQASMQADSVAQDVITQGGIAAATQEPA